MIVRSQKRDHEFHLQPRIGLQLSYNFIDQNDRQYLQYFTLPLQLINENQEYKAAENLKRTQTFDPTINIMEQEQKKALARLVQKKTLQKKIVCYVQGVSRFNKPCTPHKSSLQRDTLKSKVFSTPLYKTEKSVKQSIIVNRVIEDLSIHDLEQDYEDGCDDNSCLFYDDVREMSKQINCIQRPTSRLRTGKSIKQVPSAKYYNISDNSTPLASEQAIRPRVTPINIAPPQGSQSAILYRPYRNMCNQYQVK